MYSRRVMRSLIVFTLCLVAFVLISQLHKLFEVRKPGDLYLRHINMSEYDFRGSNLLDIESFEYVIKEDCDASFLVWIVTSYAGDATPRSALRRAYPDSELKAYGIRRVFLLALLPNDVQAKTRVTQSAIVDESKRHRDVVQGNFIEAYKNLTYKHVMGLKWATESCRNVSYLMKMDHDIVLNLYKIIDVVKASGIPGNTMMGYVLKNMTPIREPLNKWFVTRSEYPSDSYPDFLSGWLYITSLKTARALTNAAQMARKYFWIDDLFLTGIIRRELDVRLKDLNEFFTTNNEYLNCCLKDAPKKLQCDFAVGPNGGDTELQVKFKDFSQYCKANCKPRSKEFAVNNTCIVAWHDPSLGRGKAKIVPIQ